MGPIIGQISLDNQGELVAADSECIWLQPNETDGGNNSWTVWADLKLAKILGKIPENEVKRIKFYKIII